jgi:DNA-binding response OmpR family regulator
MKILIVEDEAKTAKFLKKGLSEAGFVVDVAGQKRGRERVKASQAS